MGIFLLAALGALLLSGGKKSAPALTTAPGTSARPEALEEDLETDMPREGIPTLPADEAARRKAIMDAAKGGKPGAPQTVKATKRKAVAAKKTAGKKLVATQASQASKKSRLAPGGVYTVKKGGTLVQVAKLFGVSIAAMQTANPKLNIGTKYGAGTKVRIP